jgi:hypothetical protein
MSQVISNGGIPQPWQDVEGLQLEVPSPPMDTKGVGGLVENFGPKQGMVPYGTSSYRLTVGDV